MISSQPSHPPAVRPFPEACHLPLDLIDPHLNQPRRTLEGIEELAVHIAKNGVLQPIVVTYAPRGRYTLVAGQRRLAAVRWLATYDQYPDRWRDIPAVVRTVDAAERLTLALAENLSRHALSDAETATAIRLLVDLHGWSQAELARRLGVSPQWIALHARVLADPELAQHVQTGRLSAAKAYEVARAAGPAARHAALEAALGGASLRTIRRLAAEATSSPVAAAPGAPLLPDAAAAPDHRARPEIAAAVPDAGRLKIEGPICAPLPAHSTDSRSTSRAGSREENETASHTVPFYSDCMPPGAQEQPEGQDTTVAVRTLAVHALLQEARRRHVSSLPAQSVRAALLRDLQSLGPQPA